jgi:hypothetical protein
MAEPERQRTGRFHAITRPCRESTEFGNKQEDVRVPKALLSHNSVAECHVSNANLRHSADPAERDERSRAGVCILTDMLYLEPPDLHLFAFAISGERRNA